MKNVDGDLKHKVFEATRNEEVANFPWRRFFGKKEEVYAEISYEQAKLKFYGYPTGPWSEYKDGDNVFIRAVFTTDPDKEPIEFQLVSKNEANALRIVNNWNGTLDWRTAYKWMVEKGRNIALTGWFDRALHVDGAREEIRMYTPSNPAISSVSWRTAGTDVLANNWCIK